MVAGQEMRKDDDFHGLVQSASMISMIVLVLDVLFWTEMIVKGTSKTLLGSWIPLGGLG